MKGTGTAPGYLNSAVLLVRQLVTGAWPPVTMDHSRGEGPAVGRGCFLGMVCPGCWVLS